MAKTRVQSQICPVMVACDGATMHQGREMCGRCRETLAKRGRKKPLRGENCSAIGSTLTPRDLRTLDQ